MVLETLTTLSTITESSKVTPERGALVTVKSLFTMIGSYTATFNAEKL